MAFSGEPATSGSSSAGCQFALTPFQDAHRGRRRRRWRASRAAVGEIDQLRTENATLRDENERLANENARLRGRPGARTTSSPPSLQLQSGFDHETVATSGDRARDAGDAPRRRRSTRAPTTGIELGDVVIVQGGALAGRVTDVGPTFAKVTLISDATSTVVGKLARVGQDRRRRGPGGRRADHAQHRLGGADLGWTRRSSPRASSSTAGSGRHTRRASSIGSVVDVERDANDVVQTAFLAPAAELDSFELALVITDYDGGLPPVDQQPVPCGEDGTVPEGEVPCYTPTPKP